MQTQYNVLMIGYMILQAMLVPFYHQAILVYSKFVVLLKQTRYANSQDQ